MSIHRKKETVIISDTLQSVSESAKESQEENFVSTAEQESGLSEETANDSKLGKGDEQFMQFSTGHLGDVREDTEDSAAGQDASDQTKANSESQAEKTGRSSADDASGKMDSVSHDDIIQRAEQRRDASDLVKAAVREESERLKEIPAWENESGAQIDPRNRVGEEASKIMDEQQQASESVMERIADTQDVNQEAEPKMGVDKDSKQDKEHRERIQGKEKVQDEAAEDNKDTDQQRAKTMKYASIDPLADQEGESLTSNQLPPAMLIYF